MNFRGIMLGSGAARTIGLGFVPSSVLMRNLATGAELAWDRDFARATALGEGRLTNRAAAASVPASLSTSLVGANNDMTFYAKTAGADGNAITIRLLDPSATSEALAVTNDGNAITASLKTGGGGEIESTAAEVVAAINAASGAGAAGTLVAAYLKAGHDGTGVVTALAATALSGGADGQLVSLLTAGQGVAPYEDGAQVASAGVAAIMPAQSVPAYAGDVRGKGTGAIINRWTLGDAGNRTGSFNAAADTDFVKAGSVIVIGGKTFYIQAITSTGASANQVTLNKAAPSGPISKIVYPYDLAPIPVGVRIPRGIYLAETATVNASGALVQVVAEG